MSDPPGTRFQPGHSGNPGGRPPGARNRTTIAREGALQERAQAFAERMAAAAEEVGEAVIERALAGSIPATRLLFQTLLAHRPAAVKLPALDGGIEAIIDAGAALIHATAAGEISPADAFALHRVLWTQARLLKIAGLHHVAKAPAPEPVWAPPPMVMQPATQPTPQPAPPPIPPRVETGKKQGNTGCPTPTRFLPMAEWLAVTGMGEKLKAMRRPPAAAGLLLAA